MSAMGQAQNRFQIVIVHIVEAAKYNIWVYREEATIFCPCTVVLRVSLFR